MHKILVLVGSLRAGSYNRKLAGALEKIAGDKMSFTFADLGALPHYDNDLWEQPPETVTRFKSQIEAADGILVVTPEYNRTYSPIIGNAIAWGSRPPRESAWTKKPAAIAGTSPGAIGTAAAQALLRSVLVHVDLKVMGQPELYLQFKQGLIDDDLQVTNEGTREFLASWINAFDAFIGQSKN
ncbi:NADPH-dependent FMN reductase [Pseudohoeflea coraliihabitans]|uniref:NAD(P)H-dependent oxidoreductase n=1 Tax=Pseudohoeflea coraliihabitans TaxID=2860393 RepID=A0ABS6WJF8_9HYPH|nr:NADPH-dependent FMN reductase [Pseudohoeflea sp. DP4N28-3]MBW3096071.1 NAD(P)H-dependent oxidoreductase [Pseudohoeflea sp. DP4N28-3]